MALNDDLVLQTHLFEDRVLKASRLRIGADSVVGATSVVLYDSKVEDGARLDALSLLMKGETLPAGTAWAGIPAEWRGGSVREAELREPKRTERQEEANECSTEAAATHSAPPFEPIADGLGMRERS